jgi:hypothetical protein
VTAFTFDDRCDICGHPWDEHDAFNDCTHEDGRTLDGYCRCGIRAREIAALDAAEGQQ